MNEASHPLACDPAKTGFALAQTRFPLVESACLFAASKKKLLSGRARSESQGTNLSVAHCHSSSLHRLLPAPAGNLKYLRGFPQSDWINRQIGDLNKVEIFSWYKSFLINVVVPIGNCLGIL